MTAQQYVQHLNRRLGYSYACVIGARCAYNPVTRSISLTPDIAASSDDNAIAIAAHEYGHALQTRTPFRRWLCAWIAYIIPFFGRFAVECAANVFACRLLSAHLPPSRLLSSLWFLFRHSLTYLT